MRCGVGSWGAPLGSGAGDTAGLLPGFSTVTLVTAVPLHRTFRRTLGTRPASTSRRCARGPSRAYLQHRASAPDARPHAPLSRVWACRCSPTSTPSPSGWSRPSSPRTRPTPPRAGVTRDDLAASCRANLQRLLEALGGVADLDADGAFAAPRETGRRRAEQAMPLESVLHAYRLGYRIIWEGLVEQARSDRAAARGARRCGQRRSGRSSTASPPPSPTPTAPRGAGRPPSTPAAARRSLDALLEGRGAERAVAAEAADHPRPARARAVRRRRRRGRRLAGRTAARRAGRPRPAPPGAAVPTATSASSRSAAPPPTTSAPRCRWSPAPAPGCPPPSTASPSSASRPATPRPRCAPCRRTSPPWPSSTRGLPAALLVAAPDLAERLVARTLGPLLDLDADERDLLLATLAHLARHRRLGRPDRRRCSTATATPC